MNKCTYVSEKIKFNKDEIDFLRIFFENGDFVSLSGNEVVDISINQYDKLIRFNDGYSPVVESGYIKFKIRKSIKIIYNENFLYNKSEFVKDRKEYIEKRCTNESTIIGIYVYDDCNRQKRLLGNIKASMDGEFLVISFLPCINMDGFENDYYSINLTPIAKNMVKSIDLSLENCESFEVYDNEIIDINLSFDSELDYGSDDLHRSVSGGYIKLRLDKGITKRNNCMFEKVTNCKYLEKRLCGKGKAVHDICNLYVRYVYSGFGDGFTECVNINDIKPDEEIERLEKLEDELGEEYLLFEGGYCGKLKNGIIAITFGKNAEQTLNKLMK